MELKALVAEREALAVRQRSQDTLQEELNGERGRLLADLDRLTLLVCLSVGTT